MLFSSIKSQKLLIFWYFKAGRWGNPAVEEDVKEKHTPQKVKTLCFEAFILSLPSGFLTDESL